MYAGMYQIGDNFRACSLDQHIKNLISWRRKETDNNIIEQINEELTKCYEEKYGDL